MKDRLCIACDAGDFSEQRCDAAHLAPRGGHGGCESSYCVVPLCRAHHRLFDEGNLDILGDLLAHNMLPEIQHALRHYYGDLVALLNRLTAERWVPEDRP